MKNNFALLLSTACALLFSSCVSKKLLTDEQTKYGQLQTEYSKIQAELKDCNTLTSADAQKKAALEAELAGLKQQVDYLKQNNTAALKQLENMSVISGSQADSTF